MLGCCSLALGCARCSTPAPPAEPALRWFISPADNSPRQVVVLYHGLNNKPAVMDEWAQGLAERGFAVLRVAFSGHTADSVSLADVTPELWLRDVHLSLEQAQQKHPQARRTILAFSLGATAVLRYAQTTSDIAAERLVLLAPAVFPRGKLRVLAPLLPLRHLNVCLPSLARGETRVRSCTPLQAYWTLDRLSSELRRASTQALNLPTMVVYDPDDELVDTAMLQTWAKQHDLERWQFRATSRSALPTGHFRHELFARRGYAERAWQELLEDVAAFLHNSDRAAEAASRP